MDKEKFLKSGLLQQYALGLADEDESAEVEEYLRAYPELRAELLSIHAAMDSYADQLSLPKRENEPSTSQTEKNSTQTEKNRFVRIRRRSAAILLFALVAFLSTTIYYYSRNLSLRHQLETTEAKVAVLNEQHEAEESTHHPLLDCLDFIQQENTQKIFIKSLYSKVGRAVVYWNPLEERAMIQLLDYRSHMKGADLYLWDFASDESSEIGKIEHYSCELQSIPFFAQYHQLHISGSNPSDYIVAKDSGIYPQ